MTFSLTFLVPAMALVLAETALLYALLRLIDRLAPAHWLRERHDFALAAMALVPLLMLLTVLPSRGVEGALQAPLVEALEVVAPVYIDRPVPVPGEPGASTKVAPAGEAGVDRAHAWLPIGWAVLGLWLMGSLLLLARLAADLRALSVLIGRSEHLGRTSALGLTRDLEVRTTDQIASPMLAGLLRPTILVPRSFLLDASAAPVLEHEIAHARRADNWMMLGQRLVTALFWWNLPVHLFSTLIGRTREALCDHDAAVATGAPRQLAHALLNAAADAARLPTVRPHGLAAQAHGVDLEERVRRLAAPDAAQARAPTATLSWMLPALAATAYLLAPALGQAQAQERASAEEPARSQVSRVALGSRENLPLYEAAARGDEARVSDLLERGFDPSAAALGDGTPLMGAIRGDHMAVMRTLLAAGADPDVTSPGDGTALIAAARKGNRDAIRLLLQAGASPDIGVDGDGAALIAAAAHNRLEIIDDLLAAGADPDVAVSGDGAPLIAAALAGHVDASRRLLAAGADANGYVPGDETPLINAAQQGHLAVGKLLVAQGADVSLTVRTRSGEWRSPLSQARDRGHPRFVAWLESLGAAHEPGRD